MSSERSEEDAWRSIVANYGERAELDDEPAAVARPEPVAAPADDPDDDVADRFVPPVPPPGPRLPVTRRLAWLAVLGSPAVLVLALLLSVALPRLLGYGLVASFLGGFGYLVWTMQRSEERDPWDDGAQI